MGNGGFYMLQKKFYKFRKECVNGMVINSKYKVTKDELMEAIDNIVISLEEVKENIWKIELEDVIVDNSRVIYIEKA